MSQIGLVLVGGGYFVVHGSISLGTWVLFFWLLRTIIWPVRHLGRVLADTGKAAVAIGRIREILNVVEESQKADSARRFGVTLRYEASRSLTEIGVLLLMTCR